MKKKILIVAATYYKDIYTSLLSTAISTLGEDKQYTFNTLEVPGVFEIPVVISRNIKNYDGFIALGCVIKGETPHFDFISKSTIDAIMKLSIENKKPIGNGIITCLNKSQAEVRSNKKGIEAAKALISVLSQ
jgi:6,7-dimethyl-8-ribityllumazine synthase